jgi:DNA primase
MYTDTEKSIIDLYIGLYKSGVDIYKNPSTYKLINNVLEEGKYYRGIDYNYINRKSTIETFNVLYLSNEKDNTCIKLVDRNKSFDYIAKLDVFYKNIGIDTLKIKHFLNNNRFFYMIPIQTIKGTIVSFIFRSVFKKDYASIPSDHTEVVKKIPLMFGWYKDFLNYNSEPIVVCEGLKDCIYLKQFYPYVLANNTDSIRINANVLLNYTQNIIIFYDSDKTGINSSKEDKNLCVNLGINVRTISIKDILNDYDFKDVAELINFPNLEEFFKINFLKIINNF